MEEFPLALILASQEEVSHNNNVLYRLVKTLPDGSGVQSTEKLVNVVPFRRVYTFYHKREVVDFEQLLLARPLVLQPVLHFGRGAGSYCGACYNDEPWVVMLNQTHPKILGRFQMGMDLAKQAIEKGQSVEMRFCFTNLIQRIYNEHLQQKEKGEAQSFTGKFLTMTRFAEWEHADLTIRYHGYEAKSRTKKDRKHHKTFHKEWDFDDIGSHEMQWNQIGQENFPLPPNSSVSEEELRRNLPSWTINEVSPLQDYGYDLPKQNYSYAQAGKLYESFRKKKRQRPQNPPDDSIEGATAGASYNYDAELNQHSPAIEHDFSFPQDNQSRASSRARRAYMKQEDMNHDNRQDWQSPPYVNYHENEPYPMQPSGLNELDEFREPHRNQRRRENVPTSSQRKIGHTSESHTHKHVDANVLIQASKSPSHLQQDHSAHHQNNSNTYHPHDYHLNNTALTKRDSDRSTNADSGFGDGQRSRGGSYDYNDHGSRSHSQPPKTKHALKLRDHMSHDSDEGLDNPAFNHNDSQEDALERHKNFVAQMLAGQESSGHRHVQKGNPQLQNKPTDHVPNVSYSENQKDQGIAESFI